MELRRLTEISIKALNSLFIITFIDQIASINICIKALFKRRISNGRR